jgi:hypothetical protein
MLKGVSTFEETNEFDVLTQAYNALPFTAKVARLGYQRVGFTNDDDGQSYTLHLADGQVTRVVKGLDSPEFTASGSMARIQQIALTRNYSELLSAVSVPMAVKMKAFTLLM